MSALLTACRESPYRLRDLSAVPPMQLFESRGYGRKALCPWLGDHPSRQSSLVANEGQTTRLASYRLNVRFAPKAVIQALAIDGPGEPIATGAWAIGVVGVRHWRGDTLGGPHSRAVTDSINGHQPAGGGRKKYRGIRAGQAVPRPKERASLRHRPPVIGQAWLGRGGDVDCGGAARRGAQTLIEPAQHD